jgi:succinyl-CoA synthetase beta subunit
LKPARISHKELYLGAVVDRATRSIVFMASTEGGVEIEKVAHETPEKIHKAIIDPLIGAGGPIRVVIWATSWVLNHDQVKQFVKIFQSAGQDVCRSRSGVVGNQSAGHHQ